MDRLRVVPPYGKSFVHPVERSAVVVGRSTTADLHVADRFLSRQHARLYRSDGDWWIEDLGSRNGSWLNGKRIDHPTPFHSGDRVRLSNTYLLFGAESGQLDRTPSDFITADSKVTYRSVKDVSSDHHRRPGYDSGSPESIKRQADHLHQLNEIHSSLSEPVDLEGLLERILDRAFDTLSPEQGVIYLKQPSGEHHRAAERSVDPLADEHLESQTLLRKVAEEGLTAHVYGLDVDPDWQDAESMLDQGVKSLIAAPLVDGQGSLGMIAMSSRNPESPFGNRELEMLVSIASVASLRIRNLLLTEDAMRQSLAAEQIDRELKLARKIQVGLLPSEVPEAEGFELHGCSVPCRHVSGDYYQLVTRQEGQELLVMVADVVGKGLGASLLTASLEALAAGPIEIGRSPVEICYRVGRRLHDRTTTGKFATMFVASLKGREGSLTFANAGQNPGLLISAKGRASRLKATGPPLGLFLKSDYSEASRRVAPGDLLVVYTDGITEAVNPKDQEYGLQRLTRVCKEHRHSPLKEIARAVENDISEFARGHPYEDDRTLVLVRRTD